MGEDVTISREAFDFLMGEGPFEGHWFGDPRPDMVGKFWWRSILRKTARTDPDHIAAIRLAREALAEHPGYAADVTFAAIWKWLEQKDVALTHLDTLLQTKGDDRGEG